MTKKINRELEEFCSYESAHVPDDLSRSVLSHVERDLDPHWPEVLAKLVLLQGFVGILTLFFCPQFDLSFTANDEAYHYFHRHFGLYGCMAVCGALFMGSGAILAAFVLRFSEVDLILSCKYLLSFALSGVAVIAFMVFGAEIYLGLAISWIVGGAIASILALDGGKTLRGLLLH